MFVNRTGIQSLLKDGGKHFSGMDEAIIRNIDACRKLSQMLMTSLGPNCMNKLIINHIDKHFVTSDASTMMEQFEVQHPAAKVLVAAAKMQEIEFGDATKFVIIFAGELLSQAESLIQQGLHTADIIKGYELASSEAVKLIQDCVAWQFGKANDAKELAQAARTALCAKSVGCDGLMVDLVCDAVRRVMPSDPSLFKPDYVRVAKINSGSLHNSSVVNGLVITRTPTGSEMRKANCKVMVLAVGLEASSTETKGTVLIESASQLLNYTKNEEAKIENEIRAIKDSGVEVIIVGGHISDISQHFCNKFEILTLKVQSKFELQRICQTLGASAMVRVGAPLAEEVGHADLVCVEEFGSRKATCIRAKDSKVSTIVLRGATANALDEVERSIEDAVSCIRAATRDGRFVVGAGATEMRLAYLLGEFGSTLPRLEQYAVQKFAESLEIVCRVLAENAGHNATEVVTQLYASHKKGLKGMGVDVTSANSTTDVTTGNFPVLDHLLTKLWALKFATDAALTVLRVDQIIMAKPAGGPKPPQGGHWDEDE